MANEILGVKLARMADALVEEKEQAAFYRWDRTPYA